MEKRRGKVLSMLGGTAACMMVMAAPAYAQGQETASSATNESPAGSVLEAAAWEKLAAANVDSYANIRAEASLEAQCVGVLPGGAAVEVLEQGETWTKVGTEEFTGYIRNDLLVYGQEAQELYRQVHGIQGTVEAAALRIRREPSLNGEQIGLEPQGAQVELRGRDGDWFRVRLDGADAYMFAEYISVNKLEHTAMTEAAYQEELKRLEEERKAREAAKAQEESKAQEAVKARETVKAQGEVKTQEENSAASETAAEQAGSGSGEAQAVSASGSELDLLAAIIQCEAGGESHTGKVAVGAVIMNRIRDSRFPDSISGVVYQSGQFSPVASGGLAQVLSQGAREDCYAAAREALNGSNPVGNALYFNSGSGKGIQIGNQHFY